MTVYPGLTVELSDNRKMFMHMGKICYQHPDYMNPIPITPEVVEAILAYVDVVDGNVVPKKIAA